MNRTWGSGEEWQRAMTNQWVEKMRGELATADIILDGQTRPSFIIEACRRHNVDRYEIILLDCSDDIRKARLNERGHADLASEQMVDWARYLREETQKAGGRTVNNDDLSIQETAAALKMMTKHS
jgi:dephospho-CoA kinase